MGVRHKGGAYLSRHSRKLAFMTVVPVQVSQHWALIITFTKHGIGKLEVFSTC